MDARIEALEKAKDVKLRVKIESPEVQEVLKQLGYEEHNKFINKYKHIKSKVNLWAIGIDKDGYISIGGVDIKEEVDYEAEQRYQVELYLLIIAGITTFE